MPSRPNEILDLSYLFAQGVENSIVVDSSNQLIQLVGDQLTPGASYYYGTNSSGVKGWYASSSGSIPSNSVTNAMLVNVAQSTLKGRAAGAGTGAPQDLSVAQVKTLLAYTASDITNVPAGGISAVTVQLALNGLDTAKQPLATALTSISGLSPSNNDILCYQSGAWANVNVATYTTLLALTPSSVGLGNVNNTSDANKPVSTAQAAAIALMLPLTGGTMSGAIVMGGNKVTGLANGSVSSDAVAFGQLSSYATTSYVTSAISTAIASGSWTTMSLVNGWVGIVGDVPQYRTNQFGTTEFRGGLSAASSPTSATFCSSVPQPRDSSGGTVGINQIVWDGTAAAAAECSITSTGSALITSYTTAHTYDLSPIHYSTS